MNKISNLPLLIIKSTIPLSMKEKHKKTLMEKKKLVWKSLVE